MESHDDDDIKQPEVSLEVETESEDLKDSVRILTEKLSAALANVSAKDDLVKQHAKVAEEAVAGINLSFFFLSGFWIVYTVNFCMVNIFSW